ncbi:MAG: DsbC family protein [Hydrogenovibrio sp.]|nr:DsbC family protein [Hydrogenovibrio sp.]
MKLTQKILLAAACFSLTPAYADEAAIQQKLKQIIPNAPDAKISKSVIPGLYEVMIGTKVLYIDEGANYAVSGNIINLETRQNLTTAAENKARKKILSGLDESQMIVYPAKGKVKHTLTVFSDIDCPYCRKLHDEIPMLTQAGFKVRYLAYPRAGVGSESYHKAVSAWCATDRVKALDQAMSGKKIPEKTCQNPVMDDMRLAEEFGVNGTPNILVDTGEFFPGYVPAKELIKRLAN